MNSLKLLLLLLACCWPPATAAGAPLPIPMHHTSWTAKDGAPPYIIAMAQTPDGWLWLASTSGLFRFDGINFERFQRPGEQFLSNNIWGMRLLASGALWIGYRRGNASVWQDGHIRNFGVEDGLPANATLDFEEDAGGRVWAATALGILWFDGRRWHQPAPALNAPATKCTLLRDRQRTLLAQCEDGAYALAAGAQRFVRHAASAGVGRLVQGTDDTVWSVGGPDGKVLALAGPGTLQPAPSWPAPRAGGGTMLFDRDGRHLWVVRGDGVLRVDRDGGVEMADMAQGMSGAVANFLLQDREGNLWVGTENGLDRFRPQALSGVALPQVFGDSIAIAAAGDGGLWVGNTLLAKPERAAFAALPKESEADMVTLLWRESADSLWIARRDGLWNQRDGTRVRLPLPDGMPPQPYVFSMARDRDGDLWISVSARGVYKLHAGKWEAVPALQRVNWIYCDRDGRMWFTLVGNRVAMLSGGKLTEFGPADGLQVGIALQVLQLGREIWVGGENGLYRYDGKRFERVLGADDEGFYGVSGLVAAQDRLWLNGLGGVVAIDAGELAQAARDGAYRVRFRRYDHRDGLRGAATQIAPLPSAVVGSDQRLWFTTTAGVFWLDGARAPHNPLPPPVRILRLASAGVAYPAQPGVTAQLPPRPGRVSIDYTALSLTMPERMRFQYRLDGVDADWQDGGTARSTTYTDLAPGAYRFQVRAANNDGVWSADAAEMRFVVAPALHQAAWFRALVAVLLALALWGLYRLRVAQLHRQVRARYEERLDERERISRELHDTFLQTVQGLVLKIHAVFQRLPPDEPAKAEMERSLQIAERALSEGRDRVRGLRVDAARQPELGQAVRAAVADAFGAATCVELRTGGAVRPLAAPVFEELFAIAREAMFNAAHHAQASRVVLAVDYGREALTMSIVDDGCGIAVDVQQAGHLSGHFGMTGMRERAARIGATLSLANPADGGTCWRLVLSARLAYAEELA